MSAEAVPTVSISGEPLERGRQLGAQAGDRIHRSIEIYGETFEHYTGLGWEEICGRAATYVPAIDSYDPDVMPEMRGIAEGAGVGVEDILALNVRTEVMYGLSVPIRPECTAFAARAPATAEDEVLIGQNWDWRPVTSETCILLEVQPEGRPSFVTYVEAGLLAKMGFNSAGVGLVANLLITDRDHGEPGVPFHVVLRGILTAPSFAHALHAISRAHRSASANYIVASAHGEMASLETAPGGADAIGILAPTANVVCHANTFCGTIDVADVGLERLPDSPQRQVRMRELLAEAHGHLDVATAHELLRDHEGHPASICRHPDGHDHPVERLRTNCAAVVDLSGGRLHLSVGQPCEGEPTAFAPAFARDAPLASHR